MYTEKKIMLEKKIYSSGEVRIWRLANEKMRRSEN
jgi:hypothetical protein